MVDKEQLMKILELNYIKGRSYVDIAEQLGITRQTVSKICKAYEQHREEYLDFYHKGKVNAFIEEYPWVRNGENNRIIKGKLEEKLDKVIDEELRSFDVKQDPLSDLIEAVIVRMEDEEQVTFTASTIRRYIVVNYGGWISYRKIAD